MITKKQKIIYASAGGATAASIIWLHYAKSAGKARGYLGGAGEKAMRTLRSIHGTMDTIQKRAEEINRFVQEMVDWRRFKKSHAETVVENGAENGVGPL
jgi:hypothetical protein